MSAEAQNMNPQAAYEQIVASVSRPIFFEKLAQHGVVPRNETEAAQLLQIGSQLIAMEAQEAQKQASASGSILDLAMADLGLVGDADNQIKVAASRLIDDAVVGPAAYALADALGARTS